MSAPTTTVLLDLARSAETRTLRRDESRKLREGIQALDTARRSTAGLHTALHHADRDRVVLSATIRRINNLVHAWQAQRPSTATTDAAIDSIRDALKPALTTDAS